MRRLFLDTSIFNCYCNPDEFLVQRKDVDAKTELLAVRELIALYRAGEIVLCTNEYVESELRATPDITKREHMLGFYRTLTLTAIHGIISGARSRKGPYLTAGSHKICGGHEQMEPILLALEQVLRVPACRTSEGVYWDFEGEGFIDVTLLASMLAF